MKQGLYTVSENVRIAPRTFRLRLEGDTPALERGGQFVNLAPVGFFLRRPLAARAWDSRGFDVIYKTVGRGTEELSRLQSGDSIDALTGLGNGFDASRCRESALVVSGGLGASPLFSLVKELVSSGKKVCVIAGFNTAAEIVLKDEYRALCQGYHIVTMDGSLGIRGLVTDAIDIVRPSFDYFYTCGPKAMMKAVCEKLEGPGEASLEERMGCGCGICYGCTCRTASGPKRVCADGPVFRKEEIIW